MEKIQFCPKQGEPVDFYVLEQTTVAGTNYILVTDTEDGDGDALILRDISSPEEIDAEYEIVSDDAELKAVADIFANLMEDIEFI